MAQQTEEERNNVIIGLSAGIGGLTKTKYQSKKSARND